MRLTDSFLAAKAVWLEQHDFDAVIVDDDGGWWVLRADDELYVPHALLDPAKTISEFLPKRSIIGLYGKGLADLRKILEKDSRIRDMETIAHEEAESFRSEVLGLGERND